MITHVNTQSRDPLFSKPLTVSNIKCHVYVQTNILVQNLLKTYKQQNGTPGKYGSYLQRRFDGATYFIYPTTGCVNITGLKDFNAIHKAVHTFLNQLGLNFSHVQSDIVQDNTTASAKLAFTVQLGQLWDYLLRFYAKHFTKCMLDTRETGFKCLRLSLTRKGSICIFPTGSILILAVNNSQRLLQLCNNIAQAAYESQTGQSYHTKNKLDKW